MNPSPGRFRRESLGDPIMLRKALAEPPSLEELLSKVTLQLASSLTIEDKEVLAYLIDYGHRSIGAPVFACKSPWPPWKSSAKASRREQISHRWSISNSCTEPSVSSVVGDEVSSKRSTWLLAKHKVSCTCDCFSCYASFWSKWNLSANRDLMNEILDVVEEGPKSSKGKKKKRSDKKRAVPVAEACQGKQGVRDENAYQEMVHVMPSSGLDVLADVRTSKETFRFLECNHEASFASIPKVDGTAQASIMLDEAAVTVTALFSGCKMSMFRVTKQKEKAHASTLKAPDSRVRKDSEVTGLFSDGENGVEAAELTGDDVSEAPEMLPISVAPSLLSVKSTPRLHRLGKRRQNQVIPLDCEGLLGLKGEHDSNFAVGNTQAPISPRAADIGLGGRGFLARVFPDALGRVASRLWDLVSVRVRSRTVEYH